MRSVSNNSEFYLHFRGGAKLKYFLHNIESQFVYQWRNKDIESVNLDTFEN